MTLPIIEFVKELKGSAMTFEYFPGDHFTVGTPEYCNKGLYFSARDIENDRVKT